MHFFGGFHCFFAIFGFFYKFIQNMGQKLGSNKFNETVTKGEICKIITVHA